MRLSRSTDDDWEQWGQKDPYFAVHTDEAMRQDRLNPDALERFFASGQAHMHRVFAGIRRHIDPDFSPRRALDFGCGTGRLIIPMSAMIPEVTGMDVASTMLEEARRNIDARNLQNIRLLKSDDSLSQLEGTFDFIHSYIVFQHIPEARGRVLFKRLTDHLAPGGVGALHILFANTLHPDPFGQMHPSFRHRLWSFKRFARRVIMRLAGRAADPDMQMNSYNLNALFLTLQTAGIRELYTDFEDHGGVLSAFLYFRKP